MSSITAFQGEYRWLSTFWDEPIFFRREQYRTPEHAYQAAKFRDPLYQEVIRQAKTPGKAKRLGAAPDRMMVPNWKDGIEGWVAMYEITRAKYWGHPDLEAKLLATGDTYIMEGNTWHDQYWGNCVCGGESCVEEGRNYLGWIIMSVRKELQDA